MLAVKPTLEEMPTTTAMLMVPASHVPLMPFAMPMMVDSSPNNHDVTNYLEHAKAVKPTLTAHLRQLTVVLMGSAMIAERDSMVTSVEQDLMVLQQLSVQTLTVMF